MDVLIVSSEAEKSVNGDDHLLLSELCARGLSAAVAVWTDPGVDWASAAVTVVRSPWDYHRNYTAFLGWIDRVAARSDLINPPRLLRWNSDKRYLAELEQRGFPTAPTIWIPRGSRPSLSVPTDWDEFVIKPAVSASAWQTAVFRASDTRRALNHLSELLAENDAMLQPRLRAVDDEGERSLIFIDGRFTHAVLRPSPLRFADAESRCRLYTPTTRERGLAEDILNTLDENPAYARIDLVREGGELLLLELELVEPDLFLRFSNRALLDFANLISRRVTKKKGATRTPPPAHQG